MAAGVHFILGAFHIGTYVNLALFGITVIQQAEYIKAFPGDRPIYKVAVHTLAFLGLFHTVTSCYSIYNASVTHYGQRQHLDIIPWSFCMDPVVTGLIAGIVQVFYAYRIYILSARKLWIPVIILFFTVVQLAFAFYSTIYAFQHPLYSRIQAITFAVDTWLFTMSFTDILITSTLVYYLSRAKASIHETNHIIDRVIRHTVANNGLTACAAIGSALLFAFGPGAWHVVFGLIICKLYQISFMSSLNGRATVRQDVSIARGTNAYATQMSGLGIPGMGAPPSPMPSSRGRSRSRMRDDRSYKFGTSSRNGSDSGGDLENANVPIQITVESTQSDYRIDDEDLHMWEAQSHNGRPLHLTSRDASRLDVSGLLTLPSPVFGPHSSPKN